MAGHKQRDEARRGGGRRPGKGPRGPGAAPPGERVWLYGLHAARAALANPARRIHRIVAVDDETLRPASGGPAPEAASRRDLDGLLGAGAVHQGIAVLADRLVQPDLETVLAAAAPPAPLVVLDRVTDPHNVGAILRSAAAFGARAVIATERHAAPETGALAKAAAGALERVPLVRVANLARALDRIAAAGWWLLGLDAAGARTIAEAAPEVKTAIVLGAEGAGLRRLTEEHCDEIVRLPMAAASESLNVSNACAIALYELSRGRPEAT